MAYYQGAGLDRYPAPIEHFDVETHPHDRPHRQHTYHGDRQPAEERGREWHDRPHLLSTEGRQSSAPAGSGRFPGPEQRGAYFITHQASEGPLRKEPNVLFQGNEYASSHEPASFRHLQRREESYSPESRAEEAGWDRPSHSPRSWQSASPPLIHPTYQHYQHHDPIIQRPNVDLRARSGNSSPGPQAPCVRPHFHPFLKERTPSPTHDISTTQFFRTRAEDTISEDDAVDAVKTNIKRKPHRDSARHRKILRSLIYSQSYSNFDKELQLDHSTLSSIFLAVNTIFFDEALSKRVTWTWSDSSSHEYDSRIVGRTTLSAAPGGGYNSSITLSRPILSDPRYNRHLLISAFIHELIHCYLFTCCGFAALKEGGHTPGFREIAKAIDEWAGRDILRLGNMEADLKQFLDPSHGVGQPVEHSFCYPPPVSDGSEMGVHYQQEHKGMVILNEQHHRHGLSMGDERWAHEGLRRDQGGHTFMMTRSASDRGAPPPHSRYGEERMWH